MWFWEYLCIQWGTRHVNCVRASIECLLLASVLSACESVYYSSHLEWILACTNLTDRRAFQTLDRESWNWCLSSSAEYFTITPACLYIMYRFKHGFEVSVCFGAIAAKLSHWDQRCLHILAFSEKVRRDGHCSKGWNVSLVNQRKTVIDSSRVWSTSTVPKSVCGFISVPIVLPVQPHSRFSL